MKQKKTENAHDYAGIIAKYRRAKGMSRKELADIFGISSNAVSNWENGFTRPTIEMIPMLSDVLDMPVAEFLGLPSMNSLPVEERNLIYHYRKLSVPGKKALSNIMTELLMQERGLRREQVCRSFIPLPKEKASAAAGVSVPLEDEMPPERIFVRVSREAAEADRVIAVNGASMEPTFSDGELLYVKNVSSLREGDIGIFLVNSEGYVKEYRADGLYSHNEKYPVMRFTDGDVVRCVGKVLGAVPRSDIATKEEVKILEEAFA